MAEFREAIRFVRRDSENWDLFPRPFRNDEIGIEQDGDALYLLIGDNYLPSMGAVTAGHKRLRLTSQNQKISVTINGEETDQTLKDYLEKLFEQDGNLNDLNLPIENKQNLVAAINKIKQLLNTETENRAAADSLLGSRIDGLEDFVNGEDNPNSLQQQITDEATTRQDSDERLDNKIEELGGSLSEKIEDEIGEHNFSTSAHPDIRGDISNLDELKAPKHSPVFTGLVDAKAAITEVSQPRNYTKNGNPAPYANLDQAATVKDWKDLYEITIDTAGQFLIALDTELEEGSTEILLRADKDDETEADTFIEYDNAFQEPSVTQTEWKFLYDLVMSSSGETIVIADDDSETDTEIICDRAYGYPDELVQYDASCCEPETFDGAYWVDG